MAAYRLAKLARRDWAEIIDYTVDRWGEDQARRYDRGLEDCLNRLVASPRIGRSYNRDQQEYRRFEYERHVVFYRIEDKGIFVVRIFHQAMLPRKYRME